MIVETGNDAPGAFSLKPGIIAFFAIKLHENEMPLKTMLASLLNETNLYYFNEKQNLFFFAQIPFRKKIN